MASSAHLLGPLGLEPLVHLAHALEAQFARDLREERVAHALGAVQPAHEVEQLVGGGWVELLAAAAVLDDLAPRRIEKSLSAHRAALVPPEQTAGSSGNDCAWDYPGEDAALAAAIHRTTDRLVHCFDTIRPTLPDRKLSCGGLHEQDEHGGVHNATCQHGPSTP